MGIRISIFDGANPVPQHPIDIVVSLMCDGSKHAVLQDDIFNPVGPTFEAFRHPEGFIGCYRYAMDRGWKDTVRGGKRVFLGPCCSGKNDKRGFFSGFGGGSDDDDGASENG